MGKAERRQESSEPIRQDIVRLKAQIEEKLSLSCLSWQRGLGTTHLRGSMQGLLSMTNQHPNIANILRGDDCYFRHYTDCTDLILCRFSFNN